MHIAADKVRAGLAIGAASLLAGCVEPTYVMPGPLPLQPYPPAVSYQSVPDYRPPISAPIPLQAAPLVQPLPPPTPAPTVTEVTPTPTDDTGAIPVQDMPPPVTDASTPPADAAAGVPAATADTTTTQAVRKTPTTGPGSNVPLEGFRPMHGQSRSTP